jgi:hypothetical protein
MKMFEKTANVASAIYAAAKTPKAKTAGTVAVGIAATLAGQVISAVATAYAVDLLVGRAADRRRRRVTVEMVPSGHR